MSFSSAEGYRSVQSNRGTYFGTWFFEITLVHLGGTGHCRLGIGTARQEIDAPCGYTESSYGYRDVDGSKVHKAWREPFAEPYKEGDTIGCVFTLIEWICCCRGHADIIYLSMISHISILYCKPLLLPLIVSILCQKPDRSEKTRDHIPEVADADILITNFLVCSVYLHLPEGGKPHETKTEVVRWRGRLYQTDDGPSEPAKTLVGSLLGFSINGKWQVCSSCMFVLQASPNSGAYHLFACYFRYRHSCLFFSSSVKILV